MALKIYLKDGTTVTTPGPASVRPWPQDDNYIQGVDPNGVGITIVPAANVVAAEIQ